MPTNRSASRRSTFRANRCVIEGLLAVGQGVPDTSSADGKLLHQVGTQVLSNHVPAEGEGQAALAQPPFPQVHHLVQPEGNGMST